MNNTHSNILSPAAHRQEHGVPLRSQRLTAQCDGLHPQRVLCLRHQRAPPQPGWTLRLQGPLPARRDVYGLHQRGSSAPSEHLHLKDSNLYQDHYLHHHGGSTLGLMGTNRPAAWAPAVLWRAALLTATAWVAASPLSTPHSRALR